MLEGGAENILEYQPVRLTVVGEISAQNFSQQFAALLQSNFEFFYAGCAVGVIGNSSGSLCSNSLKQCSRVSRQRLRNSVLMLMFLAFNPVCLQPFREIPVFRKYPKTAGKTIEYARAGTTRLSVMLEGESPEGMRVRQDDP